MGRSLQGGRVVGDRAGGERREEERGGARHVAGVSSASRW